MDKADLETYQVQLDQVETALQADPQNAELAELQSELQQLIELTKQALAAAAPSTSAAAATKPKAALSAGAASAAATAAGWAAGDDCLAKYSGDGQFYPARIASVGGSTENRVYSVVFKGYNSTEVLSAGALKALPRNQQSTSASYADAAGTGTKRKLTKAEEDEREKKKKKNEKKLEVRASKAKEQNEKQQTWQKFAKKSEKKGIHIAGTSGTSIFKTPDNPLGKVGVTGSGNGMTSVASRSKHKFAADEDAAA